MLLVVALVVLYWIVGLATLFLVSLLIDEPIELLPSLCVISLWPLAWLVIACVACAERMNWGPRQ